MTVSEKQKLENWTHIDWLTAHVAGWFHLYEEFPWNVTFDVKALGPVSIVAADLKYNFEESCSNVWMVFDINGELYKIIGTKDSYGGSDWDRSLNRVTKKEKVTYEYV